MLQWEGAAVGESEEFNWQAHTDALHAQLGRAQFRIKKQTDPNRTEREFQVGESILLKLQPYAQSSVANRPCAKLSYKFFGPFTVEQHIGAVAYKLALPDESCIHPVFHVSQLITFTPDYTPVFGELPRPPDLLASSMTPVAILDRRMVKKGNQSLVQLKIQWDPLAPEAATWEDYHVRRRSFSFCINLGGSFIFRRRQCHT